MPQSHPQHGAVFGRVLMDDLADLGIAPETLLASTSLKPGDLRTEGATIPFDRFAVLFERAAELTGNDLLGFERGKARHAQRAGALAYVGMSAPTVRHLLKNVARYARVFSDAIHVSLDELDSAGRYVWSYNVPASVKRRQATEFNASGLLAALRAWTRRDFPLASVAFSHPRNAGLRDFERYFGCEVNFGRDRNALRFRPEDLDLPLITADDDLLRVLKTHCDEILHRKQMARSPDLLIRLERAIADRLATGEAKQDIVARDLGLSRRTLTRHLGEYNSSFREVLERLRQALAESYLRDSDLPQAEIAYLLGYSRLSSFSSAHRRWTGQSPRQARTA